MLPAKPDPLSGEPRPPRAPDVAGPWDGCPPRGRRTAGGGPAHPQRFFPIPDPFLETVRARRRNALRLAALTTAGKGLWLLAAVSAFVLLRLFTGRALPREDLLDLSLITLLTPLGCFTCWYLIQRNHHVYAGAGWIGDSAGREQFVTTYDLARIQVARAADGVLELRVVGGNDVALTLPLGLLEGSPRLWDLVHNGLRHSVAAGAATDPATRELLRLPPPGPDSPATP